MFSLLDTFLQADGRDEKHNLTFCAHRRAVETLNLASSIPHLQSPLQVEGEPVIYRGFVRSPFLDEHVDPQRTRFTLSRRGELLLSSEVTWEDVKEAVLPLVESTSNQSLLSPGSGPMNG